ncbi:acyl-CoA dehydrogenase family protein [Nocardia fluminea]|uniref:acyl-CoA dehydrogenase family protein n=1 Tax=Nocardia fluminea TaxID=134984 RepID=UPI0034132964
MDDEQFRGELRKWLAGNAPVGDYDLSTPEGVAASRAWSATMHRDGYAGITWPEAYGGRGLGPECQAIFYEETAAADAPAHLGLIGLNMAGPTIIAWGTEEQKKRFLPPMLSAEEVWCQGFSEPGSGSDLASITTRAVSDGDHWVVDGQKVWSSFAHLADWCILLVRTDPDVAQHEGLSYLLVDMKSPGVEVRPLRQLTGDAEFNEIFFTGVRVPKESMLGKPGEGWKVAMTTLMHERGTLGFQLQGWLQSKFERLLELAARPAPDGTVPSTDPAVRAAIAREWVTLQALRNTNYRYLAGTPGPEASVTRVVFTLANQRTTTLGRSLAGMWGGLDGGFWQHEQLRSRGNSIEGGTSEILRNIIAERVLGLPRSR